MSTKATDVKRPVQARSRATFDLILDTAATVIVERGLEGFNTNIVAELASINIGTIYHYFADKNAILQEVMRRTHERNGVFLEPIIQKLATATDVTAWLDEALDVSFSLRQHNPALGILRRAFNAIPKLAELDAARTLEYADLFGPILAAQFSLDPTRARNVAIFLVEIVSDVLDNPLMQSSEPLQKEFRLFMHTYFAALGANA